MDDNHPQSADRPAGAPAADLLGADPAPGVAPGSYAAVMAAVWPNFTARTTVVDGMTVAYRVGGPEDAPAMIHVHGFAVSGNYLMPTADRLVGQFRTYVPDLPGFGRSPRPARSLGIAELGAVLEGFFAAVGIERAAVVANSLGCAITTALIERAPHLWSAP